MGLRRKIAGSFFVILILTYELHSTILVLALTNGQTGSCEMAGNAGDMGFLRRQLESAAPPEGPLLERSYVLPSGMNLSLADEVWLKIAPLISLGYGEKEIVEAVDELGLPWRVEADGASVFLDYVNLRVARSLENGEVSLDIPVACDSSLSSVCYEVKGVRKRVKLYNVTSMKHYNVSIRASDLYEVAYSSGETGGFSEAMLDLKGDLKNNIIDVYFPNIDKPVFSEICFNLPSYWVALSLKVLESKVYDIGSGGGRVDCYWIHVNATLRVSRDVFRVLFRIRHGGGWVNKPWLILRRGEYSSNHWVKWTPSDKLIVDFDAEGFGNRFILNFGETLETGNGFLSRVLSEDELKSVLEQPPFFKLDLSKAPKVWNIRFIGEKVSNETVRVTGEEYERLARLGWREKNSVFIDSGETEWEYAVTSKTLGQCKSIRLFYKPLKVNRGELAHGLTLKNYADANVSYTLRLRTTTGLFFFFSKVEEGNGGITLNRVSTSSLLLVQKQPASGDAVLELVKDGRVIAGVKVYLALKATMYWKGFWDGLATKLPGIIVTAGVMVAIGFLVPHAYIRPVYYLLLGLGVLSNVAEVALEIMEADKARGEMLTLAEAFENRSREFLARGEAEHAAECMGFAIALRREVNETTNNLMLNVFSDLAVGVSIDEIRIAFGLKEPLARDELERQYRIGFARGRVTGAAVSCVLYVALFIMVNRIKFERVGQRLTAGQVLRMIARGVYNWITPAIWDAIITGLGRIKGFAERVIDLLLANKYSRRFGDAVGGIVESVEAYSSKVDDALDTSSRLSKNILESVPSRESSRKILDIIGSIVERYSLEELKEKGGTAARSIISTWIKDGDEAIDCLNNWLYVNSKDMDKMRKLDEVLAEIRGDAAKGVGLKMGEIVDTCLDIEGKYGVDLAKNFLHTILRNPDVLADILKSLKIFMEKHEVTLKKDSPKSLKLGGLLEEGTYGVRLHWIHGNKEGMVEFFSMTGGTEQINIPKEKVNEILDSIGVREAKVEITKVKTFDYRLSFPVEFSVGSEKVGINLFGNEMKIGGKSYRFKPSPDVWGGGVRVDSEFEGRNIEGKNLILSFYQDGKVGIEYGGTRHYVKGVRVETNFDLIRIEYLTSIGGKVEEAEYCFNLKPLSEQMVKIRYEVLLEERQTHTKLKERLFRLLGYNTLKELEEGIGSKYGLLVGFDNDKKAYTGGGELRVKIPEGATKIEWIKIVFIEEKLTRLLHEVIETMNPVKIGEAGERIVIGGEAEGINYKGNILAALSQKAGIGFGDEVKLKHVGGKGEVDGEVIAGNDITINGVVFKEGDIIAIIEMQSTVMGESLEKLCKGTYVDLKNHIELDEYRNVQYGIAIGFSYEPEGILIGEPGKIRIEVYTRVEIEKLEVKK